MKERKLKKFIQYVILALSFSLIFFCEVSWSIDITVTGSWSRTINASNLQAGAGSDLISTYESTANQVTLFIGKSKAISWRVDVKKTDTNWHSNFHLYVKRTSGDATMSGGTSYQEVTDTNQSFFTGYDEKKTATVQLKLDGVSVQVAPATYTTTVYYTVVQI